MSPTTASLPRLLDVDIELLHPAKPLAAKLVDFDKQMLIDEALRKGAAAARAGFTPYRA